MRLLITTCLAILLLVAVQSTASTQQLHDAFWEIHEPQIDTTESFLLVAARLDRPDCALLLDTGTFYPYEPVIIDDDTIHYGGVFIGEGWVQFAPSLEMEKLQMQRFFKSDSLDRYFSNCEIHCSDSMFRALRAQSDTLGENHYARASGVSNHLRGNVTHEEEFQFTYRTLHNLDVGVDGYFHVNVEPNDAGHTLIYFDPLEREEISLYLWYTHLTTSFFEHLVSYATRIDSSLMYLNGMEKDHLTTTHISTNGSIDDEGLYRGASVHTYTVEDEPSRVLQMSLHRKITVAQILGPDSTELRFLRYDDWDNRQQALYVLLDEMPKPGSELALTFHYGGYVAEKGTVEMRVHEGSDPSQRKFDIQRVPFDDYDVVAANVWYPRLGWNERPTYDMTFATPANCVLIASGTKVSEEVDGDYLVTRWEVNEPTTNVTFNIGHLKRHAYTADDVGEIEVYYNDNLHTTLAPMLSHAGMRTGSNMEQQVADDIENAVKLYEHYFGPYAEESICVSELASEVSHSGSAYPGFVNLGFNTFIATDAWGNDRMLRSHEVAHQWWGIQVGPETYRDRWISEGFAEFSALLYLQAAEGNDKMMDRLGDYRKELFSAGSQLLGSGEGSGIIALGHRTATTKSYDDFQLVIYKKGAWVLHMLRNLLIDFRTMNEDRFFNMMKDFYAIFSGGEASTLDFRRITEKHIGEDMGWFFNQWVYDNQLPTYHFEYSVEPDSNQTHAVVCDIRTEGVDDDFFMYVPLEIEFDNDQKAYIRVAIEGQESTFTLPQLAQKPKKLRLNPFESVLADVKQ